MIQFVNGLPEQAYHAARDALIVQGFNDKSFFNNYQSSYREKQIEKIDSVVFAPNLPRNPEQACFTIYQANPNDSSMHLIVREKLAQTTAPFHLVHHPEQELFDFLVSKANGKITAETVERNISYDNLFRLLSDYTIDLKPQKIIEVKQGRAQFVSKPFLNINPVQLSFLTTEVTGKLLAKYFGLAIDNLREPKIPELDTIAIQLLGATVLADTGVFGNNPDSLSELIALAHQNFSQYFDKHAFETHESVIEASYQLLRQISYAGFMPSMLTEIYKQAYPKEVRKELGRFDTPLYLTRRIWETIPVEFLPPEQRVAIDMTCGWGSFLIAGHERLSRLSDMRGIKLNQYLYGNDNNSFTANLAKLGLLLSTHQDSWHIDAEHALEWDWLQHNQPNIIVGNPPFGGNRKNFTGDKSKPTRYEEANQFLEHAISQLAPNGYLAMLMPPSFVAAQASPQLRQKLLTTCDLLELWELPIGTFADAQTGGLVIFAQKRTSNHTPVVVRNIQAPKDKKHKDDKKSEFEDLIKQSKFTVTTLVSDQTVWSENSRSSKGSKNTYIVDYKLILSQLTWEKIQSCCTDLEKLAIVFLGATKGKKPDKKRWANYSYPKNVYWLTSVQKTLPRDFYIDYNQCSTITYPNELKEPLKDLRYPEKDKEKYLLGKKILLSSINNPSWGKRVKVAIERMGYCVSNSFWVIVPLDNQPKFFTHEIVAAILGWYVSNAWIVEYLKYSWVASNAIKQTPFPKNLTESDCDELTKAVHLLEDAAKVNAPEPLHALDTIDTILKQAYQLDEETFERLCRVYYWDKPNHPQFKRLCHQYGWKSNPITLDQQPDPNAWWEISGVVEQVDSKNGLITLWTDEFEEVITVPIHAAMPGWMLREGAEFQVKIPYEQAWNRNPKDIRWGRFKPQSYAYMNENELLDTLVEAFHDHE